MPGTLQKEAAAAGSKSRIQGLTGDQTVKSTAGILHRIVVTNGAATVQTLTLKDGATTLLVAELPVDDVRVLDFNAVFDTSIIVNPSDTGIDALVLYD